MRRMRKTAFWAVAVLAFFLVLRFLADPGSRKPPVGSTAPEPAKKASTAPRPIPRVAPEPIPEAAAPAPAPPPSESAASPKSVKRPIAAPVAAKIAPLTPSQAPAPETCAGFVGPVTPLAASPASPRYFSYGGRPMLMVGVSADNGCHLDLEDDNKCHLGNYPAILADAKARGLNKIRLWVALSGDPNPPGPGNDAAKTGRNQPFCHTEGCVAGGAELGYFRFDRPNPEFFANLRQVVLLAKQNDLFVEVTFFAPWEGDRPMVKSPWLAANHRAKVAVPNTDPPELIEVGFSDLRWSVLPAPVGSGDDSMREFQRRVIDWTVDELWCYDHLWWEIANEPEHGDVDPDLAVAWQQQMIAHVRRSEERYLRTPEQPDHPLLARHLIAVQPFTTAAAEVWRSATDSPCRAEPEADARNCRPDVINGHYTQVRSEPETPFPATVGSTRLDLGAIRLIREAGGSQRIFGLNEDNITPLGGPKGTRALRTDVTPSVRTFGSPDPVRAEAWEFLLHGGAAFDHFGYDYESPDGVAIREQLGSLRRFLSGEVEIDRLRPSSPDAAGCGWVEVGNYPGETDWEPRTESRKYWASSESTAWRTARSGREFILYIHHSAPRCKGNSEDYLCLRDPQGNCRESEPGRFEVGCPGDELPFGAYDARLRIAPGSGYRESLTLSLGAEAGDFLVEWLDPTNPEAPPRATQTIRWTASGSCGPEGRCVVTSPEYPYDIALRIVQL